MLTLKRLRQWRIQGPVDRYVVVNINESAPPRWLLAVLFVIPVGFATYLTYVSLIQDVYPVYVPFGDSAIVVAQRQSLALALSAMDCVVLAILPLSYLFRRIPCVPWGVGFGALAMIGVFHAGFFTKNLIASPSMSAQPSYARAPLAEVLPNEFVVSAMHFQNNASARLDSKYMAGVVLCNVRLASDAQIVLEYADHSASLSVQENEFRQMASTGVTVMVQVSPRDFQNGNPSTLAVSLAISDSINRQVQSEGVVLPLSTTLTPDEWYSQFELKEQAAERSYSFGETLSLGSVQGEPLSLKVVSLEP